MKSKVIAEFRRLFWAARQEHVTNRASASTKGTAHKKAVDYALTHGLKWGEILLNASVLENQGKAEAALELLKSSDEAVPGCERPLSLFLKGSALHSLGRLGDAINTYRSVVADPEFEILGMAWNNLGLALYAKGEYDEAIKAYNNALKDPKYDTPGKVWNNLGLALYSTKQYDKAIKAYNNALKDPKYDTPGDAWFNLAVVFSDQGENQKALDAYRRALEDPNFVRDAYWASKARSSIALLESGLRKESLSADDRALLESKPSTPREPTPEDRILAIIDLAGKSQYEKYLAKSQSGRDNLISVLRGWSSAVPLLEGSERFCRGGGYFLKWKNKGIVIDPGLDFLQNFHDTQYVASEIHAVLITHNHPDHQTDLKSIDDLRYEIYKLQDSDVREPYLLIWDADTQKSIRFSVEKAEHRFPSILFDRGRGQADRHIKDLHNLPFSVDYFPVNHAEEVPNVVGFKLHLINENDTELTIGYTGDTEFSDELVKNLCDCDLLIAHISQPGREELQEITAPPKEKHLGYRGLIQLIKNCKPKATLISEFWAGMGDLRISLVQAIRERTGNKAILPASIGMHVYLPGLEVECTQCAKKVPFEHVRVAPPATRFGNLSYLCESCMLGI